MDEYPEATLAFHRKGVMVKVFRHFTPSGGMKMTGNTFRKIIIGAIIAGLLAVLLAVLLTVLLMADMGHAMQQGRTAEVPPHAPEAIYLLFPKDAESELRRAVIADGAELTSGSEDILYYDGNESRRIARDRLSLYPPSDPRELESCLSGLNREIARWKDETDMRKIEFSHTGGRVKLIKFMKNGKIISYRYEIRDDGTPSPSTIVYGL